MRFRFISLFVPSDPGSGAPVVPHDFGVPRAGSHYGG